MCCAWPAGRGSTARGRAHPDAGIRARAQQLCHLGRVVLAGRHHQQQVHRRQALYAAAAGRAVRGALPAIEVRGDQRHTPARRQSAVLPSASLNHVAKRNQLKMRMPLRLYELVYQCRYPSRGPATVCNKCQWSKQRAWSPGRVARTREHAVQAVVCPLQSTRAVTRLLLR